jgi:hypothetical protein
MQFSIAFVGDTDITMPHEHSKTAMSGPRASANMLCLKNRDAAKRLFLTTWRKRPQQQNCLRRGHFLTRVVLSGE